jgi:hypothetical protein
MREKKNGYMILITKPERKSALGRPRGRWEDNTLLKQILKK